MSGAGALVGHIFTRRIKLCCALMREGGWMENGRLWASARAGVGVSKGRSRAWVVADGVDGAMVGVVQLEELGVLSVRIMRVGVAGGGGGARDVLKDS